jgi:tartrate dehydratase beta subunit/fumarate hydratase class I family protein
MVVPLSPPLARQRVSGLCAGDEVVLTGSILLLRCDQDADDTLAGDWPAETVEGGVCCLIEPLAVAGWQVARIDQPPVDRAVRALLATGARGVIATGRCLATASYAFRKYGGVFFLVAPDWLAATGQPLPPGHRHGEPPRCLVAVLELNQARLTVAHDTQGRSIWEDRPPGGGLV